MQTLLSVPLYILRTLKSNWIFCSLWTQCQCPTCLQACFAQLCTMWAIQFATVVCFQLLVNRIVFAVVYTSAVYAEIMSSRRSFSFNVWYQMTRYPHKSQGSCFSNPTPISNRQWERFCSAMIRSIWSHRKKLLCVRFCHFGVEPLVFLNLSNNSPQRQVQAHLLLWTLLLYDHMTFFLWVCWPVWLGVLHSVVNASYFSCCYLICLAVVFGFQ